ncbi:MAG: benzoate-CoA ligase family protein [Chloroflexales bacterium]|nr:benzoate-CoA ligase family protein [Chloroflexales bacterium]
MATTNFNAATYFVDRHIDEQRGERIAVLYEGRQLSYAQVQRLVNQTGNALRAGGLRMEERVLLLLLDSPEFIAAFFGAIKIGAVPIPINTNLQPADYAYILNDSRARIVIVSAPLLAAISQIDEPLPFLRQIVVVGEPPPDSLPAGLAARRFDEWVGGQPATLDPAPTTEDDVAFWLYTSGTTGTPKGAVHLHHDMLVAASTYGRQVLQIRPDDVTFSVAKLFFAYGLGNGLYFPFSVGATTVLLPDRPEPARVFAAIARYRPTIFFSAPTSFAALLAYAEGQRPEANGSRIDLASVRLCVSAGEALPRPIFERWRERFGVDILDGIGSTELLHIFISNRVGQIWPGASGIPVPGYEAKIVDDAGQEVGVNEIGSLWVKGDSAAACYWNRHAQSKRTFVGEWTNTGDKYYRDAEGVYWYTGRSDDMLKVSGQWVSPFEVESALLAHRAVLEAAVVGFLNANELTQTMAFVVLRPDYAGDEQLAHELQEFVKGQLAPYKYPRQIRFVAGLPKTATGKIQRFKLRSLAASPWL